VKYNLKQQVAQLVAQLLGVIAVDGVRDLVGFFYREGGDCCERLLTIPGTSPGRIPQPGHQLQ
jgi:hypothetical protein